jgi:tetratricopeptide (TPR) repeat protein
MSENIFIKNALKKALELLNNNSLNEAAEQLNTILQKDSQNIEALTLLIQISIKQSNPREALKINKLLLSVLPENKEYLEQIVKIYKYLSDNLNYIKSLENLHNIHPTIETARELSNQYLNNNDEEQANEIIQSFFEKNKNYADLYKGIRHAKSGRFKLAEECYKKVLSKDKNNVDALRLLGLVAYRLKNYNVAEKLFINSLQLNPYFSLAWDNLAKLYRIQNKLSKSIPAFENLIKLDSNNFEALVSLGTIYTKLARYDDGIDSYKKALLINPNNARVYLSLGHVLKTLGRRDECEKAYEDAIKHFYLSGEAYWSLANLKTYMFSDDQIKNMENALQEDMHPDELIQMHFALGKAYESRKDYAASFNNYQKGNWNQRKKIDYNSENQKISTDEQINFFTTNRDLLNKHVGHSASDPIFILGLPRAGSTLIEQILSSHSQIEGTQELPNILTTSKKIRMQNETVGYPQNILNLSNNEFIKLGKDYIEDTRWARSSKPFFIDKMPNNFFHIGLIKLILPNAKIIDARRNPLDGCFSCFKQYFAKGQHFTYDLDDIARYYKDYLRLMDFWNSLYPDAIYTAQYEHIISNPETEIKSLLKYCNVDFEDSCLEFYKSNRPVKTASSEQVRQPIYKSGLDYWKNYSDNLIILTNHFLDTNE